MQTFDDYVANLSPADQTALRTLRKLILQADPAVQEVFDDMPVYMLDGNDPSKNMLAAIAANKNNLCLYFCNVLLVDQYAPQFEKCDLGKACIRFKNLTDLPLETVQQMLDLEVKRMRGGKMTFDHDAHQYYFPRLLEKLGYQPGESVATIGEPEWFGANLKANGINNVRRMPADWLHIFTDTQDELRQMLASLDLESIEKAMWISWPKKASNMPTDITEQDLRDIILPLGWVDIKVCAIDEIWSGLKFSRRQK